MLLLSQMQNRAAEEKSPMEKYVEEEKRKQEEERLRSQPMGFDRLPGTIANTLPPSGARNTLQALQMANLVSGVFGGPTMGSMAAK
jgi:hypothetical protein